MNRNSGNVSKAKKLIPGAANNSKPNRKSVKTLSESSSLSSNRNSSAQSEEDVRVGVYTKLQKTCSASLEEQEQVTKKLQAQIKELKHKLKVMEESVDSKEYSLAAISREKDRAIGEIRRLERSNKQLRQQLNEERSHYLEEKEKFCEEMTKCKKTLLQLKTIREEKKESSNWMPTKKQSLITQSLRWQFDNQKGDSSENKVTNKDVKVSKSQKFSEVKDQKPSGPLNLECSDSRIGKTGSLDSLHLYGGDDLSLQMAALRTENAKLRSIICERDEQSYELCLRFLRMKHSKNDIKTRFQDLENEYLQVIANLMNKIDDARQEFNFIIDKKFKKPLHSTNAMYLQLVQRNSRMAFENASLRLENQCLKKELNKYMNAALEYDRKVESIMVEDDSGTRQIINGSKSDSKFKKTQKNVNFKEVRTIYKRDLNFKNSDTDSNYMSKTSTTGPSAGSLGDPKSSESVMKRIQGGTVKNLNQTQSNFKTNTFPDEILHKIFKRIDTSSCQSMESKKSRELYKKEMKNKEYREDSGKKMNVSFEEKHQKHSKPVDTLKVKERSSKHKIEKETKSKTIQHKAASNVTNSLPSESKDSFPMEVKESTETSPYPGSESIEISQRLGKPEESEKKQEKESERKQEKESSKHRSQRSQDREAEHLKKNLGAGKNLQEPSPVKPEVSPKPQTEKHEEESKSKQKREAGVPVRNKFRVKQIMDSCGLQESIDISDKELPTTVESITQTTVDLSTTDENNREKPKELNPRIHVLESEVEKLEKKANRIKNSANNFLPLNKFKNETCFSILENSTNVEGMQQNDDDPFWRQDMRLHSLLTNKNKKEPAYVKDQQVEETKSKNQESTEVEQNSDRTQPRRTEGSKRFSHRLISTSPEQLRSLLTDSQLGAYYRMTPIIVGHATTEINHQSIKRQDSNNEIVLQLVLPKAAVDKASARISTEQAEIQDKATVEKETSMSGLYTVDPTTSSITLGEGCESDIGIPVSNLPSSNSTMDVVDSAVTNDRNSVMLRTLSAPGLLESSWLDPYTICEMRDSSTNT